MSALDDAIGMLERAVARLEAAIAARSMTQQSAAGEPADRQQLAAATAALAGRIDAALTKLGELLEQEG